MPTLNPPPTYSWDCHACNKTNYPGSSRCGSCGCPSHVTARDIEIYRAGNTPVEPLASVLPAVQRYLLEFSVFGAGLLILGIILSISPFSGWLESLTTTGQLGDFVGGYIGTIFTLASVALVLATFRNQLRSSQQQNFENKYFELVKMHRDNVAEFHVGDKTGRKVFVSIIREFQEILREVRTFSRQRRHRYSQRLLLLIAYYALFFGVGPNSSRMLRSSLRMLDHQFVNELIEHLERQETKGTIRANAELDYEPLDGHQSRLGHYYRHLYQTVTYVDSQVIPINKYEYVKTIRAQLTNYEQALLLINSLTPLGNTWWKNNLIYKYRMLQNIPKDFFDRETEINISHYIRSDDYFEWQEH